MKILFSKLDCFSKLIYKMKISMLEIKFALNELSRWNLQSRLLSNYKFADWEFQSYKICFQLQVNCKCKKIEIFITRNVVWFEFPSAQL